MSQVQLTAAQLELLRALDANMNRGVRFDFRRVWVSGVAYSTLDLHFLRAALLIRRVPEVRRMRPGTRHCFEPTPAGRELLRRAETATAQRGQEFGPGTEVEDQ